MGSPDRALRSLRITPLASSRGWRPRPACCESAEAGRPNPFLLPAASRRSAPRSARARWPPGRISFSFRSTRSTAFAPPRTCMFSAPGRGGAPVRSSNGAGEACKGCRPSSASHAAVWSASICRSSSRHASSRSHSRFRRFFLPPHHSRIGARHADPRRQQRHVVLRPARSSSPLPRGRLLSPRAGPLRAARRGRPSPPGARRRAADCAGGFAAASPWPSRPLARVEPHPGRRFEPFVAGVEWRGVLAGSRSRARVASGSRVPRRRGVRGLGPNQDLVCAAPSW